MAEAVAEFLRQHPGCSSRLKLAIAQVHYDAGKSSNDRSWFARSLEIGQQVIGEAKTARDEACGRHFVGISLEPMQCEDRKIQLRKAIALMEAERSDPEDYEILGRVMGSLAETLSRGTDEERTEARLLFERRLEINQKHQVGDPRGQAMTHGGLGRLAFYYEPKDLSAAAFHFRKDLEISEAIGDQQGQIQMHSLLGACAVEAGNVEQAIAHYQTSWELSRDPVNQFFAGAGLLNCFRQTGQQEPFQRVASDLLGLAGDGIPDACAGEIATVLRGCAAEMSTVESERLFELARSTANE